MPWPKGRKATAEHRAKNAEAVRQWHQRMTSDEREAYAATQRASQPKGLVLDRRLSKATPFVKGHPPMHTPEGVAKMARSKRAFPLIADDIVAEMIEQPEMRREIVRRVMAGPEGLAFAAMVKAAELQLKSREAKPSVIESEPWLTYVSDEDLAIVNEIIERAEARMRADGRPSDKPRPALPAAPEILEDPDEVLL